MEFPTEHDWKAWDIPSPLHRFFALRWSELFSSATPDIWQVRTCNIRTILVELIAATRVAYKIDTYVRVIESLLAEAADVVDFDTIVGKHYPFVKLYLTPWRKRSIAQSDIPKVERLAAVMLGNLSEYWQIAVQQVLDILETDDFQKKHDLYSASATIAIEAVARGHSPEFIKDMFLNDIVTRTDFPFLERIRQMFHRLSADTDEYACTFLASGIKASDCGYAPREISVRQYYGQAFPSSSGTRYHRVSTRDSVLITVAVAAVNYEAARHSAEQQLSRYFAALNLYAVKNSISIVGLDAEVKDKSGREWTARRADQFAYIKNTKVLSKRVESMLRLGEHLPVEEFAQLMAAVQYHRLAIMASSDEVRFINLWVALESLCQGGTGSIIERVRTRISNCVTVGNIRKSMAVLSDYVYQYYKNHQRAEFVELFPTCKSRSIASDELLSILMLPEKKEQLHKLLSLLEDSSLIRYRIYRFSKNTLETPRKVADNLSRARQNVEWQLERIYRVRNDIMHTGTTNPNVLRPLMQHLHTYLIVTVNRIVSDLARNKGWRMVDAMEHASLLLTSAITLFGNAKGNEISLTSILDHEHCMRVQSPPFAWQAEKSDGEKTGGEGKAAP